MRYLLLRYCVSFVLLLWRGTGQPLSLYLTMRENYITACFLKQKEEKGLFLVVLFCFLQSTIIDTETWWDYAKIINNHCTHFCLLHFLKTAESHCRSASFLRYHRHKSKTDLETGVSNLKLCMTFSTKPTWSGMFFWRIKFEHLFRNIPVLAYIVHILKTHFS